MSATKNIRLVYIGWMGDERNPLHLFNLLSDLKGLALNSTYSLQTLASKGCQMPKKEKLSSGVIGSVFDVPFELTL